MTEEQLMLVARASGFLLGISATIETSQAQRDRAAELSSELKDMGLAATDLQRQPEPDNGR